MFTGNRGCLVDATGAIVRHHAGNLWITCLTSFRGWKHPLDQPRIWTPLFFLDDAVALAAGHRPCGFCRLADYRSYRDAVASSLGRVRPMRADELNRQLATERLGRGRGLRRAGDRRLWTAPIDELPDGAVIAADQATGSAGDGGAGDEPGSARLVLGDRTFAFTFGGWTDPRARPPQGLVRVITPPTSVAALRAGFQPVLHPSAR
jgi:hypothetical protein